MEFPLPNTQLHDFQGSLDKRANAISANSRVIKKRKDRDQKVIPVVRYNILTHANGVVVFALGNNHKNN